MDVLEAFWANLLNRIFQLFMARDLHMKGKKIKTQNGQFKSDCPNPGGGCETGDTILFTEIGRQELCPGQNSLLSTFSWLKRLFFIYLFILFFCSSWVNGSHFSCFCFNQRLYVSELIKECHSLTKRTLPFCTIITPQKERLICLYIIG